VAIVVVLRSLEVDEVCEVDHLVSQIVVPDAHTRIDGGDADTRAIDAQILRDPTRADRRGRPLHCAPNGAIEADRRDLRLAREPFECGVRNIGHESAHPAETSPDAAADRVDQPIRRAPVDARRMTRDVPRGAWAAPAARHQLAVPRCAAATAGSARAASITRQANRRQPFRRSPRALQGDCRD
jgi:hypothetical protein